MKQVIILSHGINVLPDEDVWLDEMKAYLDRVISNKKLGNEIEILINRWDPFLFGYFTPVGRFLSTFLPTVTSSSWRNKKVREFQKFVVNVRRLYSNGNDLKIDVVCHSFGCYRTHYSMSLDTDQPKAFYNKLIYIAPPVTSRFKPEELKGHFREMHWFCSRGDDMIRMSPIGNGGYIGPVFADGKVLFEWDFTPVGHSDYFKRPLFLDKVLPLVSQILFEGV